MIDAEMKGWLASSHREELESMGYESYQEFLDDMVYDELMEAARIGDELPEG